MVDETGRIAKYNRRLAEQKQQSQRAAANTDDDAFTFG